MDYLTQFSRIMGESNHIAMLVIRAWQNFIVCVCNTDRNALNHVCFCCLLWMYVLTFLIAILSKYHSCDKSDAIIVGRVGIGAINAIYVKLVDFCTRIKVMCWCIKCKDNGMFHWILRAKIKVFSSERANEKVTSCFFCHQ